MGSFERLHFGISVGLSAAFNKNLFLCVTYASVENIIAEEMLQVSNIIKS